MNIISFQFECTEAEQKRFQIFLDRGNQVRIQNSAVGSLLKREELRSTSHAAPADKKSGHCAKNFS